MSHLNKDRLINAFSELGKSMVRISKNESILQKAKIENPWFTYDNVQLSLTSMAKWLEKERLVEFLLNYSFSSNPKIIGMVLAGNLPLVGFHDIFCVLASGNKAKIKPSNKDRILIEMLINELIQLEPLLGDRLRVVERLSEIDAFIGTGSDNTNRYFEYYFGKYPHIFRKNRTSVAVLKNTNTPEDFQALGGDIFSYFGFGCRNVSKIYIPINFDIPNFLDGLQSFSWVMDHHKYANNYLYRQAIYLTNGQKFLDTGFLILKESISPFSQIGELAYEYYLDENDLEEKIRLHSAELQLIVGYSLVGFKTEEFGNSQIPKISDFADGIDTMAFLNSLESPP